LESVENYLSSIRYLSEKGLRQIWRRLVKKTLNDLKKYGVRAETWIKHSKESRKYSGNMGSENYGEERHDFERFSGPVRMV
jgi:hypothetical protein